MQATRVHIYIRGRRSEEEEMIGKPFKSVKQQTTYLKAVTPKFRWSLKTRINYRGPKMSKNWIQWTSSPIFCFIVRIKATLNCNNSSIRSLFSHKFQIEVWVRQESTTFMVILTVVVKLFKTQRPKTYFAAMTQKLNNHKIKFQKKRSSLSQWITLRLIVLNPPRQ